MSASPEVGEGAAAVACPLRTRLTALHRPVNLSPGLDISRSSFGGALQLGVDVPLGNNLYLNVDVKKVYIKTDVKQAGATINTFKVDPVLVGVGLGWKF